MRIYCGHGRIVDIEFPFCINIKSIFYGWRLYGVGDLSGKWFIGYSKRNFD